MLVAGVQIGVAIFSVTVGTHVSLPPLMLYQIAIASAFSLAGVMLILGGRRDVRAQHLGYFYVLGGAAFAHPSSNWMMHGLFTEAFLPLAAWQFAREFPRINRFTIFDRVAFRVMPLACALGAVMFAISWIKSRAGAAAATRWAWMLWLGRGGSGNIGSSAIIFLFVTSAVGGLLWRVHLSEGSERRKATWFLWALAPGLSPLVGIILRRALLGVGTAAPGANSVGGLIDTAVLIAVLSVPFSTAYVVLAHRLLTVRLVVHRAVRHLLARYTLIALTLLPVAVPIRQAYLHRDLRIDQLFANPQAKAAAWLMLAGAILFAARGRLLVVLDRAFIGQPLDQTDAISGATEAIGRGRTAREVAFETAREIDRTFGVSRIGILMRSKAGEFQAVHGAAPFLTADSSFLSILEDTAVVVVSGDSALFSLLPPADREWLLRGQFDVLARIPSRDRDVAGLAGIGARRNGMPWSKDELALISAVMRTVGVAWQRSRSEATDDGDTGATECAACGVVGDCECDAAKRPALLPAILSEKFQVVRRLGQGGMGVVYLGTDVKLDRPVALKTLPAVSGRAAAAMLAEAQVMARVDHQNLAAIHGLEVWRDTPVLVVEYLAGGTLSDRLARGPLPIAAALEVGATITDALSALHGAGILHRDIKPSNIGFTRTGVPKLLDFGVARLRTNAEQASGFGSSGDLSDNVALSTAVAGTPLYLSPEALAGGAPDTFVDLWSVSVVVLEAIAGTYPFRAASTRDMLETMRRGAAPDWHLWRERMPPAVAEMFERALHSNRERRFQSAVALAAEWRAVAAVIS